MKIVPVNGHILVEPLKHESFISSQKGTFEEIGIVLSLSKEMKELNEISVKPVYDIKVGDKVFFDSWLIARYPDGKDGQVWLVKYEDVRAIERNEN